MTLVFGGAYQGKLEYAAGKLNAAEKDIYRCSEENSDTPPSSVIVYELDKWILALIKAGIDTDRAVKEFIGQSKETCVIANDISSGVVPMDSVMRQWREAVGRALAEIAQNSNEVIRVFCGIPTRLA